MGEVRDSGAHPAPAAGDGCDHESGTPIPAAAADVQIQEPASDVNAGASAFLENLEDRALDDYIAEFRATFSRGCS